MTSTENLPTPAPIRKGTTFVSYYSTSAEPTAYLQVEHRSEAAAVKGSWQSAGMRKVWIYRGYRAV